MKTKIILVVCFMGVIACSSNAQQVPLEQGVVWSIESVRSWESFDGQVPEESPYAKWKANSAVRSSYNRYTPDQRKADGKFVEVLVWFDAEGTESAQIDMISGEGNILEATLTYGESQSSDIIAFAIPGSGVAKDKMMIEKWDGNLNFELEPGERTWILLLFDIPSKISEGKLQLKSSGPLSLTIPDASKK